jgi:NifU-like protein
MWDYTEKVHDHLMNPRNVGEVENPDGIGEVGNIKCGDAMRLTFKLDANRRINDIKFKTFGCGSAIASSSVLTELCKGKTLEEVSKITNKDIADALDGLPPAKMHCSVMGQEALHAAIEYYRTGGQTTSPPEKAGTLVCSCFSVTDLEIEAAIRQNKLTSVEEVTHFTKAGGGCGGCQPQIEEILARVNGTGVEASKPRAEVKRMTNIQKIEAIRAVIDSDIRPLLQQDGGDCDLVDVDGNVVYIRFTGHCAGCAFNSMTQASVVEDTLKKRVLESLVIKQA